MKSTFQLRMGRQSAGMWFNIAMLLWLIVGAYLEIPLPVGANYIPGIMMVLAAPVLMVRCMRTIVKNDIVFIGGFFLLTALSIIASPGWEFIGDKIKSSVQICFSCCLMLLILKSCEKMSPRALYWCFCLSSVTIASGLLLEFFSPGLKQICSSIRDVLYAAENTGFNYSLYDNLARDIAMVGRDRASFLTTEPSAAAEGVFILSNCCLVLRRDPLAVVLFAFSNFAAFFTTGSPVAVASLGGGLLTLVTFDLWRKPMVLILGCLLLCMGFAIPQARDIFAGQLQRFQGGMDELGEQSIYSRIGFPYMKALPSVVERAPVFGVGVGGKKVLVEWSDDSHAIVTDEYSVGTNALVRVFLFYGLLGGVLFFSIAYIYLKRLRIRHLVLLAGIWCFYANTTGALESPRFWTYNAFLIAAFHCASRTPLRRSIRNRQDAASMDFKAMPQACV